MRNRSSRTVATIFALAVLVAVPTKAAAPQAEASAMEVLDVFMAAFNARDIQAVEAQLHFPHYRIASGTVTVVEKAGTRPDLFRRFATATPG